MQRATRTGRGGRVGCRVVVTGLLVALGCAAPPPPPPPARVDPAIYERIHDPADPHRARYAEHRARRARDMASRTAPRPLPRHPAFHRTAGRRWDPIEKVLRFDWRAIRVAAPRAKASLAASVRVRIAFDHPDLEVVQLMIGPGGLLPLHADGAPGAFVVVGGDGEIYVDGRTAHVAPGSTVLLAPYALRRLQAGRHAALRLLWLRWAPGGDQAYVDAGGHYLTGANQHLQPARATLPEDYLFWDAAYTTESRKTPSTPIVPAPPDSPAARAAKALETLRRTLGPERERYAGAPVFGHAQRIPWRSKRALAESGVFFAPDVVEGRAEVDGIVERVAEVSRHKSILRAVRPDGGWDLDLGQSAWGPRATFVAHSHAIPELYYVLSGPVRYEVDGIAHQVRPGDVLFNNGYAPHAIRGVVDGLVFESFTARFAPNGDRSVFTRPSFLVEPLPTQPESARLSADAAFH